MSGNTAVIGSMVEHSLSPLIHNYWLNKHNISGEYGRINISPDNFDNEFSELKNKGLKGVNITVPFKERAINFIDYLSDEAKLIGAVNTVFFGEKTSGYNTDAKGFYLMLKDSGWKEKGYRAVILGAGGAARAIAYALKKSFSEIIVVNRDINRAEKLGTDIKINSKAISWDKAGEYISKCDLLVNTTSLGMKGQPDIELDLSSLDKSALVADIVYVPEKTGLLKRAEEKGNKTVGGIGMLLHQAALAFEIWYGIRPEIDDNLKKIISEALAKR